MFDFYCAIGSEKAIPCSFIAIVPQNTQTFMARIGNKEVQTKPEHHQSPSDWVIITKEELIDTFNMAILNNTDPWKQDWIAREKINLKVIRQNA